jgi:hypothetical protein
LYCMGCVGNQAFEGCYRNSGIGIMYPTRPNIWCNHFVPWQPDEESAESEEASDSD